MTKEKYDTIIRYSPLEVPRITEFHFESGEPANFTGEPSTVKSQGVYDKSIELADKHKREFFDWNRSTYDEKVRALERVKELFFFADVRSSETNLDEMRLQDINSDNDYMTFKYGMLFKALSHPKAMGILFLDEFNLANNMTKAQFYKLVNDHCIGDLPLAKRVLVLSAGNEAEHARNTTEDPVPLVLRRANYFIRPLNGVEWLDYANRTGHHEYVTGFIAFRRELVHSIRYDLPDGVGQPCPRTWTKLSNTLKANSTMSEADIAMIANGFIGQAAAKEFIAYVKSAKKVDIDSILARPSLIQQYEGEDLSLQYAIIQGIVERWRADKKVLGAAMLVGLAMARVPMGTHLFRQIKNVDRDKFMKTVVDKQIVPDSTIKAFEERYVKFLV